MTKTPYDGSEIAIVGMACRLPGADDPESFWRNLVDGVESIRRLTDEELSAAGVDPAQLRDPRYVPAASVLDDVEGFDAGFFGYNAAEAKIMDPQQRVFLECCWEALEHAGYAAPSLPGPVGVYAGSKTNTYLFHLAADRALVGSMDFLQLVLGGDQAMLATRVAYKMGLEGPAYSVQSACSSSLLSVHLASQSLLLGECRMALAGGVAIHVPHRVGYRHQEGGILSPDGHCRAFDADAQGTIFGSGAGVVVLKRLEEARSDGDHVYALIRGSAVNNDGSEKASFTAPSVEGQTQVILEALAVSGVEADSISYVEAHGTGTPLGDPIEVLALTQAYRASTDRSGYCAIGSVKTNLGHLDAAAGITSLLKTALALDREVLPPSLHYRAPNPGIDFASSPFFVNAERTAWPRGGEGPRRAAVSSFGFGGTNSHVILEEAPAPEPAEPSPRDSHLLLVSARSGSALEAATDRLAAHLDEHGELDPADVAFTLQVGRRRFGHRRFAVAGSREEAARALRERDPDQGDAGETDGAARSLAFLFPGQGTQYPAMAAGLYDTEPVFRRELDAIAELARPLLGRDLREVWRGEGEDAGQRLRETGLTQPVVFAVEVALARLLESWGLVPRAMIGHSIGEIVAATLAGVFPLEDAVRLVVERGRLMQALPAGAMGAVSLPEAEAAGRLGPELSLAAVNGPNDCVVSGETAAVEELLERLEAEGVRCRRLHTSHAFHSAMMEPMLDAFRRVVGSLALSAPSIPVASNVTGTWLTAEEAQDSEYWVRHLRGTVRFADGLATVLGEPSRALVEVGPGTSLATLARRHPARGPGRPIVSTLRHPKDGRSDTAFLWSAVGRLWLGGVEPDWTLVYAGQRRRRVALPTYPFEHRRHWIDVAAPAAPQPPRLTLDKEADLADWCYRPAWQRRDLPAETDRLDGRTWLLLGGADELTGELAEELSRRGAEVALAEAGERYARPGSDRFTVRPDAVEDYGRLFSALDGEGRLPEGIVHLWSRTAAAEDEEAHREAQRRGFFALTALARALGRLKTPQAERTVAVVTAPVHAVTGGETLVPDHAPVLGPVKVVPKEIPGWRWRHVDLDLPEVGGPEAGGPGAGAIAPRLAAELVAGSPEAIVAYRGGERWAEGFERARVEAPEVGPGFVPEGVYLVTGGLGGVGFAVAHELAAACRARLVLVGRTELPPRERWDELAGQAAPGDGVAERIGKIRRLEALGARVLAPAGDVADRRRMAEIVEETLETFGALDGVVHAAGIAGGGLVQLKSAEAAAAVLRPKIEGLRALTAALGDRVPGRILLFSSLQSVLGDFGQVDYAAANAYLDAWAEAARRRGLPATSIGWDNWRDVGIAAGTELPAHLEPWRDELLEAALAVDEGVELLRRLWHRSEPRWVISTQDLAGRREMAESFTGRRILGELGGGRPAAPETAAQAAPARVTGSSKELERRITAVWERVLEVQGIGLRDNFFDLGGNSLTGMQLVSELSAELGVELSPVQLFESPSIAGLVERLRPDAGEAAEATPRKARRRREDDIAVIGMAGRFPGADGVEALWANLLAGTESIRFFTEDELRGLGVSEEQLRDPDYVPACPVLDGADRFDAELFGYSPRDARIMDPQHRVFLETVWTALEDAGYDSFRVPGPVGVFAGSSISSYLRNLYSDPELMREVGELQALLGNEKDSLPTRVSYKLNLQGPSLAVQTFCSTSLVAVHLACRNLLDGECDMAVAGGVSIHFPQAGYVYDPSGGVSKDGHLRAFDAEASGYVFGNGAGAVVLKRLSDALADGDPIRAVVKGSAVNNDGSVKAGFTATAVEGQARVAAAALAEAGVDPGTIGYVETHGSATPLGDPVEIAALGRVLDNGVPARCPVGSIKTNVGHLDRASGVAGLIKTVLTLENGRIPRSLHFETPNPNIDFASSPFYVATDEIAWPRGEQPRRAAVNSLGLGGTNAHVILEEAPTREPSGEARPWHLLPLSAKTPSALAAVGERLAGHLSTLGDDPRELADVAYTLAVGRRALENRRILVCRDVAEARRQLVGEAPKRVFEAEHRDVGEPPVVFLFPGLGSHYVGMGRDLYRHEPVYRQAVDECAEILEPLLGADLRTLLYPPEEEASGAEETGVDLRRMLGRGGRAGGGDDHGTGPLAETRLAQPTVFVVEYALARLWTSWGVVPTACLGYSVGEYVAACVAGVYGLEDALKLVARRAELIQELPAGAMLGVPLTEAELEERLSGDVWLAAVNGASQSVVAGPVEAVEALERELAAHGTSARRLSTTHAFHTPMLTPVADALTALAAGLTPREPEIPYLSNVTGTWVTLEDLQDPEYWARHMCRPVRFADAVAELTADPDRLYLEVGPGQTLSSLILQGAAGGDAEPRTVASLRHAYEREPDRATMLTALGKLWLLGVEVDWAGLYRGERRLRARLPTYPFERRSFWVEPAAAPALAAAAAAGGPLHLPSWRRSPAGASLTERPELLGRRYLVFTEDDAGVASSVARALEQAGAETVLVRPGERFERGGDGAFAIDPCSTADHVRLLEALGESPDGIVHGWGSGERADGRRGFGSLSALAEALGERGGEVVPVRVWALVEGVYAVSGDERLVPERAATLGPGQVFALKAPGSVFRAVDVVVPEGERKRSRLAGQIVREIAAEAPEQVVALRGAQRWVPELESLPAGDVGQIPAYRREGGVYLVLDGAGSRGLPFARRLAALPGARLAVTVPEGAPEVPAALREAAGEVLVLSGVSAAEAAERVRERWGEVHGVVYAGPPARHGGGVEEVARDLAGLDDALARGGGGLDFALLVATLGTSGDADLAGEFAVNLFFDAFAEARDDHQVGCWASVNWDLSDDDEQGAAGSDADPFHRVPSLARSFPRVLVSRRNLARQWNRVAVEEPESVRTERHPRPRLKVAFVEPRTDTERTIAHVWQDLLGLERVGVHDDFLELGGDSLLASRLTTRLRQALGLELPVRLFFEASTVEELGRAVESLRREHQEARMARLLDELEGLSDDEVRLRLEREQLSAN